jgi:formate-dependent nitrite reductase cytochrome c552 subunit
MARNTSIILSKEEKKAVVTELKGKIKDVQTATKAATAAAKFAAKEHATFLKTSDKTLAGLAKELAAHQAKLSALTAPTTATA